MDSATPNIYEEQLYSVFRSFAAGDSGLERAAALQLCDTLQLEDRGAALVDALFERRDERVSFAQFRAGLLSALAEPAPPADSDDDSGREVAPKFVVGAKKYGRRSRPQRAAPAGPRPRGASEPRSDCARAEPRARGKRSASAMDSRDDAPALDHDRPVDRERALALCRGLRMSGVDRALVDRAFAGSATQEMTVGEFFDRLNASLSSSIADTGASDGDDALCGDAVAEAWERAGVERPRRLLAELGFTGTALRPLELERALDDELRALAAPPDERALLLLAALTLARLRLDAAARHLGVARAERDKLRDDLAEANRRARLLAQDVDDNHARLEAELQAGLRQLEARHAEAARVSAAEAAAERERAAAQRRQLDEETARRVEVEARLRFEVAAMQEQINELQDQTKALELRAAGAEREAARATREAGAAAQREAELAERARLEGAEAAARLGELRAENQRLRDRVDELAAALEASARRAAADGARAPSWRDEVAMHAAPRHDETPELAKKGTLNMNRIVAKLQTICDYESSSEEKSNECRRCGSLRDLVAALRGAVRESSSGTDPPDTPAAGGAEASSQTEPELGEDVEVLLEELNDVRQRHEIDKRNMSAVIEELQRGAERLRAELERCEEYWAAKLDDERELLAEEQRAGDERLAELVAKIAEYERQFARPALPAIDESAALERQVTDLELELAAARAAAAEEVSQLQRRVEELERRLAERAAPPPAPPAAQHAAQHAAPATRRGVAGVRVRRGGRRRGGRRGGGVGALARGGGRARGGRAAGAGRARRARRAAPARAPRRRGPARQGPVHRELPAGAPAARAAPALTAARPPPAPTTRQWIGSATRRAPPLGRCAELRPDGRASLPPGVTAFKGCTELVKAQRNTLGYTDVACFYSILLVHYL